MKIHEYIESGAHRMVIDKLNIIFLAKMRPDLRKPNLSMNPHLKYSDVAADKTANWDWSRLSANPGITLEDILSHPDDPWVWGAISCNPGIQFEDVMQHLDRPWNWAALSANETVTIDIVMKFLDRPWSWYKLSKNISIRLSDIQAHPNLPWNFQALSHRPISNEQIIMNNFGKWKWYYLSEMASFDLIQNNPDWPWQWDGVCRNSNVPLAFIPAERRDYFLLSGNHKITIQDVLARPDANWSWNQLSTRIDFQDILRHPELPWGFYDMARNRCLRLDHVMTHLDKPWCLAYLAQNSFADDYIDYYNGLARQHMAALKIQLYWRKYASDHRFLMCHRVQLCRMYEK